MHFNMVFIWQGSHSYAFFHGIPIAGEPVVFLFSVVFLYLGSRFYTFLYCIPIAGEPVVCIFIWYSYSWGAILMHFLCGIRIAGKPRTCILIWCSYSWRTIRMHCTRYSYSWGAIRKHFRITMSLRPKEQKWSYFSYLPRRGANRACSRCPLLCIFTCVLMESSMYAFLHGIPIAGEPSVCIFTWYS
jgi:hypothetical protein